MSDNALIEHVATAIEPELPGAYFSTCEKVAKAAIEAMQSYKQSDDYKPPQDERQRQSFMHKGQASALGAMSQLSAKNLANICPYCGNDKSSAINWNSASCGFCTAKAAYLSAKNPDISMRIIQGAGWGPSKNSLPPEIKEFVQMLGDVQPGNWEISAKIEKQPKTSANQFHHHEWDLVSGRCQTCGESLR